MSDVPTELHIVGCCQRQSCIGWVQFSVWRGTVKFSGIYQVGKNTQQSNNTFLKMKNSLVKNDSIIHFFISTAKTFIIIIEKVRISEKHWAFAFFKHFTNFQNFPRLLFC